MSMSSLPLSRSNRLLARLALAALAATAGPARAADDAGTRSVFAVGAGNRALGMATAFTAVADDASAALWNPGGLGLISQAEIQFSQASLAAPGVRESYFGVVYPRWGWGVASLTYRQFGAGGVEARDDRNFVTGQGLEDRQSEIALGYGGAGGEAWSLGGVAKLRRQELAGRSGAGLGADLGLKVAPGALLGMDRGPVRDVRLGITIVNALEPTIRLDRESVPDPLAVRVGAAYTHGFPALGALLVTLDAEKTRGLTPRVHAGFELTPLPRFALRGGFGGEGLAAGTGIRFGDASLDYVYEDRPLGASHRAGLSLRFGATMSEARESALAAEEQRLEKRFAELERRRQAERLGELLGRAEEERAARRFDDALAIVAMARVLDVGDARAAPLEAALHYEKGIALEAGGDYAGAVMALSRALAIAPADSQAARALSRCRAESDARARRSAEIRRQFAAALDAFVRDDLRAARAGFARVLEIQPGDSESRTMLQRADAAIAQRREGHRKQAALLIQAGLLREAAAEIERMRTYDPAGQAAAGLESQLARAEQRVAAERAEAERARHEAAARSARAAKSAEPSGPPPLTPQQARELESLYRRGLAALQQGRSAEAMRYWELIWSLRPGYERVDSYLKREYQTRGMEAFAAGRLEEAVSLWERALPVDPADPKTVGYLARAHEQLARTRLITGQEP